MTTHGKTHSPADDLNPFRDLTKAFEQFQLPTAGESSLTDATRKDVEALIAANKSTYMALQALARTQTDMLTQAIQAFQASTKGVLAGDATGGDATKHTEAAQRAWQKMLADMKNLAETVQKAQGDAMAVLTQRAQDNAGALKELAHAK